MHASAALPCDVLIPELDEPGLRPTRDPPPGRAADSAEVTLRLVQEHDRIAGGMNDIVVHRLFCAGLSLETALGLMGDHPGPRRSRTPSASWTWRSGTSGTCCSITISLIHPCARQPLLFPLS